MSICVCYVGLKTDNSQILFTHDRGQNSNVTFMFGVCGRNSLICIQNIDQLILMQVLEKEVDLLLQRDNTRLTDVFATLASKMFDNIPGRNDHQTSLSLDTYET